jgi:enoyl-CoA hydratase/carnithine racemase
MYVKTEKIGHIFRIILNRPERLNAQGQQIIWDRRRAWHDAMTDPDVRVVVLSGEGRIFCAGRDIRDQAAGGVTEVDEPNAPVADLGFYSVPETDIPLITMVQGGAWGLGFYQVCASDICVAAEGARFAMSEIPTGIIGPALFPILNNLPWLPGSEIVIRGHQFPSERAYELGLVNHVVPADQLEAKTMELAEEIAGLPPVHVRVTKQQLMMARPRPNAYQTSIGFPQAMAGLRQLDDTMEAATAFAEKRTPVFKGR